MSLLDDVTDSPQPTFYGPLTKTHFESETARDYYETQEALRLSAIDEAQNPLNDLTAEQIRALADAATKDDAMRARDYRREVAASEFVAAHPEYVPNPRNGAVFAGAVEDQGLACTTVEELESVYERLRERGALEIDESKAQQTQVEQAPARRVSSGLSANRNRLPRRVTASPQELEQDAYSMPLENLRELAMREMIANERKDSGAAAGFTE